MKNNNGFSLVELIVVIAIMAILAAVAVIGVSVYIPKTQKAADEQMVADIQKAVDLYTNLESVTPGQSGYIVIHKDKGTGTVGNVSVGGTMDTFLTEALEATFGEDKYGTELKVSYDGWTGFLPQADIDAIKGSVFIGSDKVYGEEDGLLETVEMLTDAMKFYYGDQENAQKAANQTVLDVAAGTQNYINREKLIKWWTESPIIAMPTEAIFNENNKPTGENEGTKLIMAV